MSRQEELESELQLLAVEARGAEAAELEIEANPAALRLPGVPQAPQNPPTGLRNPRRARKAVGVQFADEDDTDGRPTRLSETQQEQEPEPEPGPGPQPELSRVKANAAWGEVLLSEHVENTVVLEARLAWTQAFNMRRMTLPPGKSQQVRHEFVVGSAINWCVGIAAYSIAVRVSFASSGGDGDQILLQSTLLSADDSLKRGGALMVGTYTAQSSGILEITFDNSGSSEERKLTHSVSQPDYVFTFNRKGLLVATPKGEAVDEDEDDEEPEEIQMDLCEVEDNMIAKVGDNGLIIELPPRRRDEPARLEGKQVLQFDTSSTTQEWETQLRAVLKKAREARLAATTKMQELCRVGFAKRVYAAKKRNRLLHEHRRRAGSVQTLGSTQDEYSEWSKPHGKLKLQNKPIFHAFENAILTDLELVQSEQGGVGHFFESGLWWQAAPKEVHAKSTVVYGSHAKHSAASNSGCVMYSADKVDVVLAFCWPVIGKQWVAGKLYAKGTAPSLEVVYDTLVDEQHSSPRSPELEEQADEKEPDSNDDDRQGTSRTSSGKTKRKRSRRRSVTEMMKITDRVSGMFHHTDSSNSTDVAKGSCILKGYALEWSQTMSNSDQYARARWTLCTETEHKTKVRNKAEELARLSEGKGTAATEVVEEIIQLQFFHPLFRKYDGSYWRLVPSQNVPNFQVPAWSDSKGRKLGHWKAQAEEVHAKADRLLLPFEGNWVWDDDPWTVDTSGSDEAEGWQYTRGIPHVPGHPCNNLPELPGVCTWSASEVVGSLVRRRTWQRIRRKRKQRIWKKTDLVNPFLTTTVQPVFIARITASNGDVLSIWRPRVQGTKMILGDVVMKEKFPPDKMTIVDPAKVQKARSEEQREWVKRVARFQSVWDNGKVYMWRPLAPTTHVQGTKRLHPLGWIFTTSPGPPDIENVCVIHEEYLQQMTEGEVDALPSWSAQGSVFEAAKFSDRTVPEQVERFDVEITAEELGLVLKGVDVAGNRRKVLAQIEPGSAVSNCEGLQPGMLLFSIMGFRATTLQESAIDKLLLRRPLRLAFEKAEDKGSLLTSLMDTNQDGKVNLSDFSDAAGSMFRAGLGALRKSSAALTSPRNLVRTGSDDADDTTDGVKPHEEVSTGEGTVRVDNTASDAMLFLERKNKLLFASFDDWIYRDIPYLDSFWMIKKDIQPEDESDTIARSSRYTPHLKALQLAGQAQGDEFVCSAMMTELHSTRNGLEMITGSGSSLRAWDISKGECVRELKFPGVRLSCLAAAANTVFSGSGRVLTGIDVLAGKKLAGTTFMHTGLVTCVDALELSHKDASGRPMIACVSGSDVHDGVVRLWVSDEGSSDDAGISTGDNPQIFRRVGMPGIGEHRTGGVTSLRLWPQNSVGCHRKYHYYRLVVMRSQRQLKDVPKVGEGSDGEAHLSQLPTIAISNFKLVSSGNQIADGLDLKKDQADLDDTAAGRTVLVPTSAVNLSYAKPWPITEWTASDHTGVDWSLAATDPEEDRQNSFISCGAGVLELYFEQPVVANAYSWESDIFDQHNGVSQAPERWQLFASHDWVNWECVDDCSGISLDDIPESGIKREIQRIEKEPVITQAPSATPDLRHVPMVVSTGALSVRVWSVCADFSTADEEKRGAKGISLSMMRGHEDTVTCCAVTKSGAVVSGSKDCTVRVWRAHAGKCLEVFRAASPILCVTTFDSPSSMHLQSERILLRKGASLHASVRYSIRQVDLFRRFDTRLSGIGGDVLLSAGHEKLDVMPIPSFGDAGEDTFEAYAWRLEAGPAPNSVYISCERDGDTLYLTHDSGNVVLAAAEDRSAWEIEWQKKAAVRPCKPQNALARGKHGDALVHLHLFYRVTSTWQVFPTAEDKGDGMYLQPGTVLQIVDDPVRPLRDQNTLWQQVVSVGEESDASFMYQKRVSGWVRVAYQTELLIDDFAQPLQDSIAYGRLRCTTISAGQPAYLQITKPGSAQPAASFGSGSEKHVAVQLATKAKGQYFKFEEAVPETTVVAGCQDGSAKIWSNTAAGGRWVAKKTHQAVQHAGAIQQVHLVATADAEASSEGMLLVTCSKEIHEKTDQTIGVWRIDSGVWSCVCRLHPMIVKDYIAGMVKYIDPGNTARFKITYADQYVTSLTANDLLRIRGQYESLFEKLVKSLRLVPAQESIANRSHSRPLEPDTSFKRERKDDPIFEDGDCYYWIQSSQHINGHSPTFVMDQRLAIEDCEVGMVIREKDTPSDRIGGLYVIVSIDGVTSGGENAKIGFFEKLFSPEKMMKAMIDAFSHQVGHPTITVSKLDDITGQPDMTTLNEHGRLPGEFTRAGFWEGFHPTSGPDWFLFFFVCMPYDWTVWLKERDIGIVQLLAAIFSWPAMLWSYRKKLKLGMLGGDEELTFGATEEDTDWSRLFESAKTGQPVEAMVVPLPGAAGVYNGGKKSWENLLKTTVDDDHESCSLLHACVSYCTEHKEENNSLLGLEVPETVIQFKWYKYGQKRTMESLRNYLQLVVAFSLFTWRRIDAQPPIIGEHIIDEAFGQHTIDHALAAVVILLTSIFMWGELTAVLVTGWAEYLPDFWNWFDWICYVTMMLAVTASARLPEIQTSWEQKTIVSPKWEIQPAVLFALPQLLLWGKVLYFLRAFEETGVFTMMIVRIFYSIRYFLVIMGIMLMAFTFTFYIMFNESDQHQSLLNAEYSEYSTIFKSVISTYQMGVLGDFDLDKFWDQDHETFMMFLFLVLTFIVQIVLLNLLIALMGSIYEQEQEHSANHRRAERASMILEIEAKMSADDRVSIDFFPENIHVLREKLDTKRKDTPEAEEAAPSSAQRSKPSGLHAQSETGDIPAAAEDVSERLRTVEEKLSSLDEKFDRLFTMLNN